MKMLLLFSFALMTTVAVIAQGNSASTAPVHVSTAGERTLIVYFSRLGNTNYDENLDASTSASIYIGTNGKEGTTEIIANMIQDTTGGLKHLIQAAEPYPADFDDVVIQARQERSTGFKPPLKSRIENISRFDTVFVGYPVWGTTIPAPVETFLSEYDLRGKTVIPFCTHDGYGQGRSFTAVAGFCPQSKILPGIAIEAARVLQTRGEIQAWLKTIGITGTGKSGVTETETPITITIGGRILSGVLNNSYEARQFREMLPQTISMVRYGGREYYGGITTRIKAQTEEKLNFINGDITYCPTNNTVAIFYSQTDRPNLGMGVISMGKVTSDLSAFNTFGSSENIRFELGGN
jgi:flavodoxin